MRAGTHPEQTDQQEDGAEDEDGCQDDQSNRDGKVHCEWKGVSVQKEEKVTPSVS